MPKHQRAATIRVSVTSPGNDLTSTIAAVKKQGMKVNSVLDAIGVITGEISNANFSALAAIPGITVERDRDVQLAPPDADIQ